ncbi:MAG TPA: hypothetical protein VHY91_24340 [Pirellulales bacterium]|nr:hypothetical protein [Pirellulales bacterium]
MSQPACTIDQQPPGLDEIVSGIGASARLLLTDPASFRIVVTSEGTVVDGPKEFGCLPCRAILAHKGDKWFVQAQLVEALDEFGFDVRIYAAKGPKVLNWTEALSHAVVTPFEDGWNIFAWWSYVRQLGYDVNRQIAHSCGADYDRIRNSDVLNPDLCHLLLPGFLETNRRNYNVLRQPETVDGHLCWVAEWPGMDRLWIERECGFAMRRRASHWAPDKPLRCEIFQHDFREVRPGLWIAWEQTVDRYADVATTNPRRWGTVDVRTTCRLQEIEFDTVSDDLFDVRLPVGTFVIDRFNDSQFKVSETGGPLCVF